ALFLLSREGLSRAKFSANNEFHLENCAFEDSAKNARRTFIFSICSDDKENIYAATNKGIFLQKKSDKQFRKIFDLKPLNQFKKPEESFYSTIAFKDHKLYFTNANTLFCYSLETG